MGIIPSLICFAPCKILTVVGITLVQEKNQRWGGGVQKIPQDWALKVERSKKGVKYRRGPNSGSRSYKGEKRGPNLEEGPTQSMDELRKQFKERGYPQGNSKLELESEKGK